MQQVVQQQVLQPVELREQLVQPAEVVPLVRWSELVRALRWLQELQTTLRHPRLERVHSCELPCDPTLARFSQRDLLPLFLC